MNGLRKKHSEKKEKVLLRRYVNGKEKYIAKYYHN